MNSRIAELQAKEVIDISSGTRYGTIGDLEIDSETGLVRSVLVFNRSRLLGIWGRKPDFTFPWSAIRRIGADFILVDGAKELRTHRLRGGKGGFVP